MKTITFLAVLVLFSVIGVMGQTSAGNMMIGGSFSLGTTSFEGAGSNSTYTSVSPSFGYFIADNLAIGAGIDLTSSSFGSDTDRSFGISPFARYYKFTSNENFAFVGQASIRYATDRDENGPNVSTATSLSFNVSPGFTYFFTKHWALDFFLSGLQVRTSNPEGDNNNSTAFNLGISLSPSLGFRYHFGN